MRNSHRNLPGRWIPKKDIEEWMKNYQPESGYSKFLRPEWLKRQKTPNSDSRLPKRENHQTP